ncbi:hypothetical protein KAFR_0B02700 [Kazachstania africana CBS 2517]|uniref:Actin-like protein ARP6 n=1 Tax=Kazachstania africana (strain ATCC 22294 / BCRC 22015 / CBS 2517 / CECT 1963 / NBRC 1671 / NRRL Y-8276) TaxID=1071382 RepID=H2AQB7_KAZAF|nr:hypothetical protein KAFR_0B02700 [Kazachstania africana CBS 2517]CCF56567.1 hypothetical protein KAFR_0B02700 [Kazachstania africana CBS 2517]
MEETPVVIDNGSYRVKFGPASLEAPYCALNAIANDKYDASYLSNQIKSIKDISSVSIKRPHTLGQLTSWEMQTLIWDYCLYNPDEFNGFNIGDTKSKHLITSETCMTLPELGKNMDQVIFEEYEFGSLMKSPVAGYMPFLRNTKDQIIIGERDTEPFVETPSTEEYRDFQLVVDSGFNCTWIIPVIKGIPYYKAVKKLDIGGRFLNGLLKETLSFRHYNVMDETILVNNIKEKCLFVSPASYFDSFKNKDITSREYVLPDFQTSFLGYVRPSNEQGKPLPEDSQSITLKDELFAVPETFFHPEISQILKPGLVETILESLSMIPEVIRPLMVSNIMCIGGNFNLPHFASRVAKELQRQLPTDWKCRITISKGNSELSGWKAMSSFASTDIYKATRVTREEYYEHGIDWCTKHRFGYQNWV